MQHAGYRSQGMPVRLSAARGGEPPLPAPLPILDGIPGCAPQGSSLVRSTTPQQWEDKVARMAGFLTQIPARRLAAGLFALFTAATAHAYKFDTPEDWSVNLDNSPQYSLGWRAQSMDPKIGNHLVFAQGDYKFPNKGDMVTDRVQDLMEFQAVYQHSMGVRFSGSAWKDFAYNDSANQNPAFSFINAYPGGHYTDYVDRYFLKGGELLDAFAFANTEIDGKPVYAKLGRLAQYWGNAFFFGFSNIAYSQSPIDYIKGFSQPGSEVKELFLPRDQILLSTELSPELSISAEYFLEFEPNRYPESGTYLGFFDVLFSGPPTAGALPLPGNAGLVDPPHDDRDFGLKLAWSPSWAGGDMGFYYRQFDEVHPWLALVNPTTGYLQNTFPRDTRLLGFSFEKSFGLVSTGLEINKRFHTGLLSASLASTNEGASGDLTNVIANAFVQLGKSPLYDSGVLLAEFTFTHLDTVNRNANLFNGVDTPNCHKNGTAAQGDWRDGCATRNALAFATLFDPQWLQVLPSLDLDMPMSFTWGIQGNPAYTGGTFYEQGTNLYSIGIKATYEAKNSVALNYIGYRWRPNGSADNGLGQGLEAYAGFGGAGAPSLNDRAWWQLQLKTSF